MRYQLEPSPQVLRWLLEECHPDAEIRARVHRKFNMAFRLIAEHGPHVGMPHLRKLRGYEIYEIRVDDRADSGWYRIFCNFGRTRADRPTVVAMAYAGRKLERSFSAQEYRRAERAVAKWMKEIDT